MSVCVFEFKFSVRILSTIMSSISFQECSDIVRSSKISLDYLRKDSEREFQLPHSITVPSYEELESQRRSVLNNLEDSSKLPPNKNLADDLWHHFLSSKEDAVITRNLVQEMKSYFTMRSDEIKLMKEMYAERWSRFCDSAESMRDTRATFELVSARMSLELDDARSRIERLGRSDALPFDFFTDSNAADEMDIQIEASDIKVHMRKFIVDQQCRYGKCSLFF